MLKSTISYGCMWCVRDAFKIMYGFGKSDIPVAVLPTMTIAFVLAGPSKLHLLLLGFIWSSIHLLTFQVKNQIDGIDEDRLTKPTRPLPSGLISVGNARVLYRVLFLLMWAVGLYARTEICTLVYSVAILIYNEGGLVKYSLLKNVLGAVGLACYCWGTTFIFDQGRQLHGMKAVAAVMIGAIFATTGHAQDFRDRAGDRVMGRKTIPLLLSQSVARSTLAMLILAWTAALITLWQPPFLASAMFSATALRCLWGYVSSHNEKDDYISYCWYGFWLLGANILPIFPRMRGEI